MVQDGAAVGVGRGIGMGMSSVEAGRMRALAAEAEPHLVTEPVEWNRKLAAHHDRLTEALRWFITSGDATAAVEMVANLRRYWFDERHHAEARELSAAAVEMDGTPSAPRYAEAMMGWARFTFFTGRPAGEAYALALAAARAQGDAVSEVECLSGLARVALRGGRWDDVRRHAQEALQLARSTGDGSHQRVPVHMLAAAARMTGDYEEARRRYAESIAIGEAMGMASHVPCEHHNLGYVELHCGNVVDAEKMFRMALEGAQRTGATWLLPYCVLDFGILAVAQGDLKLGAVLVTAARSSFDAAGVALDPDDDAEYQSVVQALHDRLDADRLASLSTHGQALSLEDAVALVGGTSPSS
jgi:tetratricopeptide (TPR) repeat protein